MGGAMASVRLPIQGLTLLGDGAVYKGLVNGG